VGAEPEISAGVVELVVVDVVYNQVGWGGQELAVHTDDDFSVVHREGTDRVAFGVEPPAVGIEGSVIVIIDESYRTASERNGTRHGKNLETG
jgi:hypothetical protein